MSARRLAGLLTGAKIYHGHQFAAPEYLCRRQFLRGCQGHYLSQADLRNQPQTAGRARQRDTGVSSTVSHTGPSGKLQTVARQLVDLPHQHTEIEGFAHVAVAAGGLGQGTMLQTGT